MISPRYIKLFENNEDYNKYLNSFNFVKPNVSYIKNTNETIFIDKNQEIDYDYSKHYFTIKNTGNNTLNISAKFQFSYIKNGDSNWSTFGSAATIEPNESVYIKAYIEKQAYSNNNHKLITMTGDSTCDVEGNIMSLVYGDDFEDKVDLTGYIEAFSNLFYNCKQLVNANNLILPATTLADNCYNGMFYGCTSLVNAPELTATILANYCYMGMFNGCTSLVTAPELPATTLVYSCYNNMFARCSNLNKVTMLATNISASGCLSGWLSGVASSGIFYKNPNMTSLPTGKSGIPIGWNIVNNDNLNRIDYSSHYFSIRNTGDEALSITPPTTLSYIKTNNNDWDSCTIEETIVLEPKQIVYFKYRQTKVNGKFTMEGNTTCDVEGNIMSLIHRDDFEGKINLTSNNDAFLSLFENCTQLVNANNLILPATTLAINCYYSMFNGCTSLITAPELPATTLAEYCYDAMFWDCTSLITAPELPATTLAERCYQNMFRGCSNLNKVTMLAIDISATSCLNNWLYGVASSGTFTKSFQMTSLPTGTNGIPEGWEVQDYTTI